LQTFSSETQKSLTAERGTLFIYERASWGKSPLGTPKKNVPKGTHPTRSLEQCSGSEGSVEVANFKGFLLN